jgi:hypothetical protein
LQFQVCSSQQSLIPTRNETALTRSLQVVLPRFMPCHSTTTLISACFLYIVGIFRLCYHNRDDFDALQGLSLFQAFILTGTKIRWNDILGSLQDHLAINIWASITASAIMHAIFRWLAPGVYATLVESARKRRQEYKSKQLQRDVEDGPREVKCFEVGVNEEMPLTGRGLFRMRGEAYIEISNYSEHAVTAMGPTRGYDIDDVDNEADLR